MLSINYIMEEGNDHDGDIAAVQSGFGDIPAGAGADHRRGDRLRAGEEEGQRGASDLHAHLRRRGADDADLDV